MGVDTFVILLALFCLASFAMGWALGKVKR